MALLFLSFRGAQREPGISIPDLWIQGLRLRRIPE
jgi:hypothetical protein